MVTSYGQLLARRHGERLDGEAREFLAFIVDGGRRAQALVGDLLGLARVSSQARPFEAVALGEVLAQALRSLRLAVDESGAVVTHDEPLPTVHGDRRQLVQLLHNLLANALKSRSDAPPRVHVGACREGGQWRVRVTDNGIGIAPQHQQTPTNPAPGDARPERSRCSVTTRGCIPDAPGRTSRTRWSAIRSHDVRHGCVMVFDQNEFHRNGKNVVIDQIARHRMPAHVV